jgi:hypothetical protein
MPFKISVGPIGGVAGYGNCYSIEIPLDPARKLAPGEVLEGTITGNKRIFSLSVSLPIGVNCSLKYDKDSLKDIVLFSSAGNESGYQSFDLGIDVKAIKYRLENITASEQTARARLGVMDL